MNESLTYIQNLIIPDGYTIDFLAVEEAKSMCSGYNEAMTASDARYKVYLHQDTFITNPHFIEDILSLFHSHPEIGLIGCFGPLKMPADGCMWSVDRYGMLWESHVFESKLLHGETPNECVVTSNNPSSNTTACSSYIPVEAIDGFLMITCDDIPWREDLFTKWDFYDASQSMEFIRHGYKVAVPVTDTPWALHDCGFLNMSNYDTEKEKFIAEYGSMIEPR